MNKVLLKYAYSLFYLLPMDHLSIQNLVHANSKLKQKYSDFDMHEKWKRVFSANAKINHYMYKRFSSNYNTLCDCSTLSLKASLVVRYM